MKFVVYESWSIARVIEADNMTDALRLGEPTEAREGMVLNTWKVIPLSADEPKRDPNAYRPWGSRYQGPNQ